MFNLFQESLNIMVWYVRCCTVGIKEWKSMLTSHLQYCRRNYTHVKNHTARQRVLKALTQAKTQEDQVMMLFQFQQKHLHLLVKTLDGISNICSASAVILWSSYSVPWNTCTRIFIATLLVTSSWKQPRYILSGKDINILWTIT